MSSLTERLLLIPGVLLAGLAVWAIVMCGLSIVVGSTVLVLQAAWRLVCKLAERAARAARALGARFGLCLSADDKQRERYAEMMVRNAVFLAGQAAARGEIFDSLAWVCKYPYGHWAERSNEASN